MNSVKLSNDAASIVKLQYQKELAAALQRVREIKHVLAELEEVHVEEAFNSDYAVTPAYGTAKKTKVSKPAKPSSGRKKKRGRKSFWPAFILKRLETTQQPLTYDEMTSQAIAIKDMDITKFDNIRKTVIASVFALRRDEKIWNYAIKGSRTKYMGLPEWFVKEGELKPEFRSKLD